jgi:hypothetical protein
LILSIVIFFIFVNLLFISPAFNVFLAFTQ